MSGDGTRRRVVTWTDPMPIAAGAAGMAGLEFLESIVRGEIPQPPIGHLLGMYLEAVEPGRATFVLEPGEWLYNPIGSVHGGVMATICDSAAGCAVHSMLPAGSGYTTVELSVNLVRPMGAGDGPVRCVGEVVAVGRRVGTATARLEDGAGRLFAHATATCLIVSHQGSPASP